MERKKKQHINRRNIGKTDLTRSKIGSGAVALPQDRFSVMKPSGFIWYLWQLTLVCMPCSRQRRGRKLGHWAACILMVFGFVFMWLGITSLPCSSATHNEGGISKCARAEYFKSKKHRGERKKQTWDRATRSSCYLRRQFGREVPSEVVLRRDQTGGVVHFDLQVGERIEERGVGHRDFIWNVVEGVHRAAIHGSCIRQVGGSRQ